MSDPATTARTARENLSRGLTALQSDPNIPPAVLEIATPIAQAMGALHQIEKSNGAALHPHANVALENVRTALSALQAQPPSVAAVGVAMESVAASLSLVHALSKLAGPAPGAQPPVAAPVAAAAPPQAPPRPQPVAAGGIGGGQPGYGAQPAGYGAPQQGYAPPPQQQPHFPQAAPHQPPPQQFAPQQQYQQPPQQQAYAPQAAPQQHYAPQVARDPFAAPPQQQASPLAATGFAAGPPPAPVAVPMQAHGAAHAPPAAGDTPVFPADLGAQSATNFYKGLSGNDIIDHGGLFVSTYMIPKIGTPVRLKVSLPGGYEFEANAIVRWSREQSDGSDAPPGFGAQFTAITPEARQLVYRYVRNREPLFHDDL